MAGREIVSRAFNAWLERYAPPVHLRDKAEAAQREADALLAAALRHMPEREVEAWVTALCDALDRSATTRCWPTVREVEAAAGKAHVALGPVREAPADWRLDDAAITARRIRNGEPFAAAHLRGAVADEMLRRGLISRAELTALREQLARQERDWR
jgi:hypothetical protein